MPKTPPYPPNLGTSGRRFWRDVSTEWELRTDELRVLERAARILDVLDRLDALFVGRDAEPMMSKGSRGQVVIHPALMERRQQEQAFAALVRHLGLADEEAGSRSSAGRSLARQRWG